eukprot:s3370_g5.t3
MAAAGQTQASAAVLVPAAQLQRLSDPTVIFTKEKFFPLDPDVVLLGERQVMSRTFIVGGNWKCNPKTYKECNELLKAWKKSLPNVDRSKVEVVICPPALWLTSFTESFEGLGMGVCAQNCGKTDAGAFTGEWTAANLVDLGLKWTLLGHSERRSLYGETDEDVAEKVGKCQEAGLGVILCIGEKLEEREGGKTDEVNKRQLGACLPKIKDWDKIVIAYEPVWAIGTGKVATPEQAEETQKAIRAYLSQAQWKAVVEVQYPMWHQAVGTPVVSL